MAPASHSVTGGALRKLRQYTRSKLGATFWASLAARLVLPMPPMPSTATERQRSSSTQRRSSASSSARPTKPCVSGASPQSWHARRRNAGRRRCDAARASGIRPSSPANHSSSNGVCIRGASRSTAAQSSRASAASRPGVRPPASSNARMSAWSRSAVGKLGAGLPVLDRAQADARPRREVSLGQSGPPAMAQEQAAKGLGGFICVPHVKSNARAAVYHPASAPLRDRGRADNAHEDAPNRTDLTHRNRCRAARQRASWFQQAAGILRPPGKDRFLQSCPLSMDRTPIQLLARSTVSVWATTISRADLAFDPEPAPPYRSNTRQYARLLVLRSRVRDQMAASLELVNCHGSEVCRATRGLHTESEDR